jgi:hypothetical protein
MNDTRQNLLIRVQVGKRMPGRTCWTCTVLTWLNRQGVLPGDLEELSQEVLLSVVKYLSDYQHSGNRGAFRSWLRTIVCRRAADY